MITPPARADEVAKTTPRTRRMPGGADATPPPDCARRMAKLEGAFGSRARQPSHRARPRREGRGEGARRHQDDRFQKPLALSDWLADQRNDGNSELRG